MSDNKQEPPARIHIGFGPNVTAAYWYPAIDGPEIGEVEYVRHSDYERLSRENAERRKQLAEANSWLKHYERGEPAVWSELKRQNAELRKQLEQAQRALMTEERVREILAHMIQPNGSLYDEECLPIWRPGDTGAFLMGRYNWEECIAIGLWVRKHDNNA